VNCADCGKPSYAIQSEKICGEVVVVSVQCNDCSHIESFENVKCSKVGKFDSFNVEIVLCEMMNNGSHESYSQQCHQKGGHPISKDLYYKIVEHISEKIEEITQENFEENAKLYKG